MDKPLTVTQQKILRFIRAFTEQNGYSPVIREIGDAVGLSSTSSVAYQLGRLQELGYLTRQRRGYRTIRVTIPAA